MCGIVASVSAGGRVSSDALLRATQRLRHRGPDAQHVWVADHGRAGLGHARLSIIDLTTGDQPIASEDESLRIVANGEFYDFEAIRTELESQGHRFRTRSDSEIALHLYEDAGARCVHRLRGEFAFAIWDERDGLLFAGRDRFGIKPLYYALQDGACHVASEIKALPELGVALRWNREALFDMHRGVAMHPPAVTAFAGVHQVPPGHYLITDGENARVFPYWDWDYPTADRTGFDRNPHDWVDELRGTLVEAVRFRLRADVPVACYLSGGLDSCAVLGLASRLSSRPLRAYTLSFDLADYDERALAEEQAKLSGAEFFPIDIRAEHMADHISDAVYHAERPIVNAHVVAKYLLSRAVRDSGVKVVLTGEGSDEVFAGYPFFRRDMILYNTEGQDPATAKGPARPTRRREQGLAGPAPALGRRRPERERQARARLRADDRGDVGPAGRGDGRAPRRRLRRALPLPRPLPRPPEPARRRAPARRPRPGQPVALHLGEDGAAQLHPLATSATAWRWRTRSRAGCRSSTTTSPPTSRECRSR